MIGCLLTRVRKQPIIALYFEPERVRKQPIIALYFESEFITSMPGHKYHMTCTNLMTWVTLFQGPSIEVYNVDLADWDKSRSVVQSIGPIDILVNNAGITNWTSFLDVTKDELEKYAHTCSLYTIQPSSVVWFTIISAYFKIHHKII